MTDTEQELFEERVAILEYDAGFGREEAERKALKTFCPQITQIKKEAQ